MAKPKPPTPDELLVDALSALPKPNRVRPDRRYLVSMTTQIPEEIYDLVRDASRGRAISTSAYIRRAVLSFVAQDLGLDYYGMLEREPGIRNNNSEAVEYAGRGFGAWVIDGLHE